LITAKTHRTVKYRIEILQDVKYPRARSRCFEENGRKCGGSAGRENWAKAKGTLF